MMIHGSVSWRALSVGVVSQPVFQMLAPKIQAVLKKQEISDVDRLEALWSKSVLSREENLQKQTVSLESRHVCYWRFGLLHTR